MKTMTQVLQIQINELRGELCAANRGNKRLAEENKRLVERLSKTLGELSGDRVIQQLLHKTIDDFVKEQKKDKLNIEFLKGIIMELQDNAEESSRKIKVALNCKDCKRFREMDCHFPNEETISFGYCSGYRRN